MVMITGTALAAGNLLAGIGRSAATGSIAANDSAQNQQPAVAASLSPLDRVSLSPAAVAALRAGAGTDQDDVPGSNETEAPSESLETVTTRNTETQQQRGEPQFSAEELSQITSLQARDIQVRAHEAAHLGAAAGIATGGASFTYQQGPNGQRYAVGGEVSISISSVDGNPEATLQKAQQVVRAALAPADPSSADRVIAAQAQVLSANARAEIAANRVLEQETSRTNSRAAAPTEQTNEPSQNTRLNQNTGLGQDANPRQNLLNGDNLGIDRVNSAAARVINAAADAARGASTAYAINPRTTARVQTPPEGSQSRTINAVSG